jgi:hypothetical protein
MTMVMVMRGLVPIPLSFMAPRVHHQKQENHKSKEQQNDSAWLIIPKLLEVSGDPLNIHGTLKLHQSFAKSEVVADASCRREV